MKFLKNLLKKVYERRGLILISALFSVLFYLGVKWAVPRIEVGFTNFNILLEQAADFYKASFLTMVLSALLFTFFVYLLLTTLNLDMIKKISFSCVGFTFFTFIAGFIISIIEVIKSNHQTLILEVYRLQEVHKSIFLISALVAFFICYIIVSWSKKNK